ncbi:hypothetical protein [Pseudoxanthomonas sp.]|nr:hypothetical protein [Pseudoxanthomonas sp.]
MNDHGAGQARLYAARTHPMLNQMRRELDHLVSDAIRSGKAQQL